MSSSPQPTPVPGPTPTPDVSNVSLPDVPPDTYQRLSGLADAIDTANSSFSTHATKIANTSNTTNGAVNNVTSNSQGLGATALADTWKNTQTDFSHAHDPLIAVIANNCMGGSPNPLRDVLNQNKSAIQTGLIAMENIQSLKRSALPNPPTAQQVEEWIQEVNALTNSLGNVNLALDMMIIALRNLNGGFAATCATGFAPGAPLPSFPKNTFAMSSSGDGGGGSPNAKQVIDSLTDPETAELLTMEATAKGISLDDIASLLQKGVSSEQIYEWMGNDSLNMDNITTLIDSGADANQINAWISRGVNIDHVAAFAGKGVDLNSALQLTRAGVDPANVLPLIQEGVSPKTILNMVQSGVNPANVGNVIENNITNLIKDSNPKLPLSRNNAINMLNGPDGTYPQVAGSGGAGADINFINPKTGDIVLAREEKSVTTQGGLISEIRSLPDQLSGYSGAKEVVFQVPSGSNAKSWIQGFLSGKSSASLAQYKGIQVTIVDPQGNVLWQGSLTK